MLSVSDLISLPYTPDLTQAGIAYACRSLAYTYNRMGGSSFDRLRRIVAGVAVELALRRYLNLHHIPHDTLGATPFTDPDHYDLSLGGRRCDIKSFVIFRRKLIRRIHRQPQVLLSAQALVPVDQLASEHFSGEDLLIFAFLTTLVTRSTEELQRPIEAGKPIFLIHPMPKPWSRPNIWRPLGPLVMKTDLPQQLTLEVGGQDAVRTFQVEQICLPARKRTRLQTDFHSLSYLSSPHLPDGQVGIHSPMLQETYIVQPHQWGNIWIYGLRVILAGYMSRGEFRQRASRLPAGSRVLQYPRTRTVNMALPIAQLHPLGDLFHRARSWQRSA